MIGHTHHTAIKQHISTIAEFDIHRKPKIRKSVFSSWSRNVLFFCRRVSMCTPLPHPNHHIRIQYKKQK